MQENVLMNKNLLTEDGRISSIDLVDIINHFRQVEDKTGGKKFKKLAPYDFFKKIKKEVDTLKNLGLEGVGNFSETQYLDSQGKKQPCYSLNRDGMIQMLNSESTFCRAKTIEYINKLEQEIKELKEDNNSLYKVAVSDEELKARQYEADKVKYAFRNIPKILSDCTYENLQTEVKKIISVHEGLKFKDRYSYHQYKTVNKQKEKINATEYKNIIKEQILMKLDDIIRTKDALYITVGLSIGKELEGQLRETGNRSKGQIISQITKELEEAKSKLNNIA